MIRQNKLLGFTSRLLGDHRPITADLFLTDYCNAHCAYCNYSHTSGRFMSFEAFEKYANRLLELGVKSFILTGGGEPTINPDFEKITKWLEEHNIPYGINTNLIKRIECEPVFLKVSIDSGTDQGFLNLRGVDKLPIVLKNLSHFIAMKKEHGWKTTVGVQCVAVKREDVISFYERLKDFDVDYIYFRPQECNQGTNIREEDVHSWLGNVNDERINYSFKFSLIDYRPKECFANWTEITVDHDGNVPYCCFFANEIVGNIMDDDILEKKASFKIDMSKCDHPCRLTGSNRFLDGLEIEKDVMFV